VTDVFLEWGTDFVADATGDLATVDADDEVRQRLERRLFTPVQGYVFHQDYGAGLPQKVGSTVSVEEVQSVVASQVALEATVAPNPPTKVTVQRSANQPDATTIGIAYFDAKAGESVSFSITA
jgi:hypothetical protein